MQRFLLSPPSTHKHIDKEIAIKLEKGKSVMRREEIRSCSLNQATIDLPFKGITNYAEYS